MRTPLQQIERSHGVDVQILTIVEWTTEGCGQVVDDVNSLDSPAYILEVTQITCDRFHVGEGIQLMGATGVTRIDKSTNVVTLGQQTCDQIGANPARAAGYENFHCGTFPFL